MAATEISYTRSGGGDQREKLYQNEFRDLLRHSAVLAMKRRLSNTLDESDFDFAYRDLLSSRNVDWTRQIVGALTLLGSGAIISCAVGYFPSCKTASDAAPPIGGLVFGMLIGALGVFIQWWPQWRRN
jgi:hypothetical protein